MLMFDIIDAQMLENAMLDVAPDDAMDMNRKRKMMRWDAKKRKFVKQTLEEMTESKRGVKKLRTEQGVVLSKSKKEPVSVCRKYRNDVHFCCGLRVSYIMLGRRKLAEKSVLPELAKMMTVLALISGTLRIS